MKKVLFAAALIFIISPIFCSAQVVNNNNNHGQDDCQCIGKGIQVYLPGDNKTPPSPANTTTPLPSSNPELKKKDVTDHNLWYYYFELYLSELRNSIYTRKGN